MGTVGRVPKPKNCDVTVRQAIQKLSIKTGPASTPTYAGMTLTGLTASRLVWSDAAKALASKDLIDLIAGTANRVTVADDAAGGVVLSGPQDIHVDATPEFAGFTIRDSNDNIVAHMSVNEFYITEFTPTVPVNGNPIGLLLVLTYAGL